MEFNYDGLVSSLNDAIDIEKNVKKAKRYKVAYEADAVYSGDEICDIRIGLNMTQNVFAALLGVSKKTVEAWEGGISKPNGSASRLIGLLKKDPELFIRYGVYGKDAI